MAAKDKGGRPQAKIDPAQVEQLAGINCTVSEMAAVLRCNKRTLERRFKDVITRGREVGLMSLKRAQFKSAIGGNVTAQIWLGKQLLGQRDFHHTAVAVDDPQSAVRGIREMVAALLSTEPPKPGGPASDKPDAAPA